MTDERPRPQYGEYASTEEQLLAGGTAVPAREFPPPAPGTRIEAGAAVGEQASLRQRRRSRDVVVTTFLLSMSAYFVISTISGWTDFATTLDEAYAQLGYGDYTSVELANSIGLAITIVQLVLLVVSAIMSIAFIRSGRTSYWVPLAFGALSIIVTVILMMVAMTSDPALANYLNAAG